MHRAFADSCPFSFVLRFVLVGLERSLLASAQRSELAPHQATLNETSISPCDKNGSRWQPIPANANITHAL